ncbi:hypothetical protein [Pleomorphovibrio marinus]|uniref:hypothetical protein n=1 Tax=Pleomorphovibrio marinus TaxID=2164132 RepID=UPI000E0C58CE|nr:hypothetical protein [Pleomorphovibrio marinus]
MVRKFCVLMCAISFWLLGSQVEAQTYSTGVGLRLGVSNGLTVKHFIDSDIALEGIVHTRWNGLLVTGLYEVHRNVREVRGLRWFYGGGAHIGAWNRRPNSPPPWSDASYRGGTVIGIAGIIGLDYKFEDAPINLSLDYKPAFNITHGAGFWGDEVALSIRFTF